MLVLSGRSDITAASKKIGPSLIFDRLWEKLGIKKIIKKLLSDRKFGFDVERAVYLTVLHRLFISGSDRSCEQWRRDYAIEGIEDISLHHSYRAMAWIGEPLADQSGTTPFTPRCIKDEIEEGIFFENRNLFTGLDIVFFDTTSIYFEGAGGETIGKRGHTKDKDQRPDYNQMVVGVTLDNKGRPICCEMWPGNTTDVKTLIPVADRIRTRFNVGQFCVVADRGMISKDTIEKLKSKNIPYILGARMRKLKDVKEDVLSCGGRYREVYPESSIKKDPSPLKVKEVVVNGCRYVVCVNEREARKNAADRKTIVESLQEKLKIGAKALIGNKGYRKYIKLERGSMSIDLDKIQVEERFDGKWVLQTNADLSAQEAALKYKQLWEVEYAFRDIKSILETRPIFHKRDETIKGHVFCSFLALVLRKELFRRMEEAGHSFEWADIKRDLKSLQETVIEDNGSSLAIRSKYMGSCGNVFQAAGVAMSPTIREL